MPAQGSDQSDEWVRLGVEAQVSGNLPLAQTRYQQALRLDPRHSIATQNLAIVFAQSAMQNEALLTIERAAMMDGDHGCINVNWGLMALEADRIDIALEQARKGYEKEPNANSRLALAMVSATAGRPQDAIPLYNEMLADDPKHGAAGPNSCFVMTLTNSTPAELLAQRQKWYKANRYEGKIEQHRNDRSTDRPIRVGYVGGDFKQHSAAFIFARVLLHHSADVEMYLYSSLPVDPVADVRTKKFQDAAPDRWRDISAMNDEDADRLIRKDKIDILVDLAGHTNGGRLGLFTRKPAPVQVTAWGFAHGTGLPEIDAFFADPVSVPADERQHYAERIIDLPCIVTMEPPVEYNLKGTSSPPLRANGYVTFGSYARYEKMSDDCLKAFAEILRRVPDSRMQFKDHAFRRPYSIRRIQSFMNGIEPERLLFSIATNHPDHLLAYQQADLCLDPWPHGGGVVSLETIFMGVPIITRYGTQPSGRSAASVLTAMGRKEWIANSPAEYIAKAVEWSDRTKELAEARKTLRQELLDSPVVNGYAEAVESKYKELWRQYVDQ
jgi:predicted O-linked N-acetylglucosamine transferase (SPINDLY family)